MPLGNTAFERPIGPHAASLTWLETDEKELEYVSALLQTCNPLRPDGTIRPIDVKLFLSSRYGVEVEEQVVKDLIFKELAGCLSGAQDDDEDLCMDLAQFVAILMIPHFLDPSDIKTNTVGANSKELSEQFPPNEDDLLKILSNGMFGQGALSASSASADVEGTGAMTNKTLRALLSRHEEKKVPTHVFQSMVAAVQESSSLAEALRSDIQAFDNDWKKHTTTTFDDASSVDPLKMATSKETTVLERKFTASFVDFMADTYRRPRYVMLLWAAGVFSYVAYVFESTEDTHWTDPSCGSGRGCEVLKGLLSWFAVFIQLSTLGLAFIFLSSFGNSIYANRNWRSLVATLVAIGAVATCSVLPYFVLVETTFFNTGGNKDYDQPYLVHDDAFDGGLQAIDDDETTELYKSLGWTITEQTEYYVANEDPYGGTYYIALILGLGLLLTLLVDLIVMLIPRTWAENHAIFHSIFSPGGPKAECAQKNAAYIKMSKMINGAMTVHAETSIYKKTSKYGEGDVLTTFQRKKNEKESIGGFVWTWSRMFNGTLRSEEGVWFHSRLLSIGMAQFLVAILVIVLVSSAYTNWDKFEYSTAPTVAEQAKDILSNSFNVTLTCTRLQRTKWFGFDQRSAAFSMADLEIDGLIDLLNYGSAGDLADDDDAQTYDDTTDDTQTTDDGSIQATGDLLGDYTTNSTDDYYVDDTTGEQVRGLQTTDDDYEDDDSVDEGDTIRSLLQQFTFVIAEACLDYEASDNERNLFHEFSAVYTCMVTKVGFINVYGDQIFATDLIRMQYYEYFGGPEQVEADLRECGANDQLIEFIMSSTEYNLLAEEESTFGTFLEETGVTKQGYFAIVTVGGIVALVACAYIPFVLFPSFVSQVLRFRSGVLPSLGDVNFTPLRFAPDTATVLFPSSFWGTAITALLAGALAACITFFIVSDVGGNFGSTLLGVLLGFLTILAVRLAFLLTFRGLYFQGFYRKNVLAANIMFVCLEAWNIALTAGFMIGRLIVITVICILFIARIDTPFLAPGVGELGPVKLDGLPFAFKRDLLSHEAHRHPYLELFGLLCLVKLRCGPGFGSRANSALRLLAVLTLMPWLKKYRLRIEGHAGDTERSLGNQDRLQILEEENAELKKYMKKLEKQLKKAEISSESASKGDGEVDIRPSEVKKNRKVKKQKNDSTVASADF